MILEGLTEGDGLTQTFWCFEVRGEIDLDCVSGAAFLLPIGTLPAIYFAHHRRGVSAVYGSAFLTTLRRL